mgnify:CR=1 FL=1
MNWSLLHWSNTMADIYLISDYGKLYKQNKVFHFLYPDGTVAKFFPHNTQRMYVIGNIQITAEALKMISHNKIEVIFLNKNGFFNGKLTFGDSKNVLLRKKQYEKLNDNDFILKWGPAGLKEFSEGTDAVAPYGSCEDKDRMSSAARRQIYNPYSKQGTPPFEVRFGGW